MLKLTDFIIDCPEPLQLAGFYAELTGRPVLDKSDADWAGLEYGEIELAFQRVDEFVAPTWPGGEHPKQYHLDFEVDDIEAEQGRAIALGATLREDFIGPEGYGWRVYTDPVGHPFCLCHNRGVEWRDGEVIWPQ